ncbi:putative WRKY transcription factor 41 [Iris pallida]|uniref:WRKY transcription factor 41 n=1 Tax=Iris pallida TaxID=29817 RepID=A0AAX6DU12_IRIPA|nr:putative WRKY transcription factor 41 [Iris pallida]KAJ6828549.1 putative WRKY transcription factor 41 [Iris pallida]
MEIGTSNLVLAELTRATELVKKLQAHIDSNCSADAGRALTKEILCCLDKSASMVSESARSLAESPRSEDSVVRKDRENKCKKRKTQAKWTSKVRLGSGPGVEGPLEDGYSWRKYGQKEILAATHPRGYFRCTHLKSQGCLAMKQVQRSEDNPSVFDVTYRGTHTCQPKPAARAAGAAPQPRNQDLLLSFQTGLKVKTEGLDSKSPEPASDFSFPSAPEALTFSPSSTLDGCFVLGGFSSAFISPASSESNYFGGQNLQAAEWDFTEIVSAATCADHTHSTMFDMDFLQNSLDLDLDFPFDAYSFPPIN